MTVLVTGGTGFIGPHVVHALRVRDVAVRALVRDSGPRLPARGVGCRARRGRRHRRRLAAEGLRGRGRGRPSRRDHQGLARRLRSRHDRRHAEPRRGGAGRGRPPLRADERARRRRALEGRGAVLRREVADGEGGRGVRSRARRAPAELRLRAARRCAAGVPATRALRAGDADRRRRDAAAAADLGRGPRRVLRARASSCRRRPTARSSSAGRMRSPGTSSGRARSACSACGGRRSTCRWV